MVAEFNITDIIEKFMIFHNLLNENLNDNKILKTTFYTILPDYLKTEAKVSFLNNIKNKNLTKQNIVSFLKKQTMGKDCMNFDILLEYLDIKTNEYDFPKFNDKLKFAEVKKEALFIWWIINILRSHEFIKKYWHLFKGELQKSLDHKIAGNNNKKYDIFLSLVKIIIEIDEENHGNSTLTNDTLKDSLARMNGAALIRLRTKDICLGNKKEYLENLDKMQEFRDILINVVIGSLMRIEEVRKDRLKYMFEKDIIDDIKELETKLHEKMELLKSVDPESDEYDYHKKRMLGLNLALDRKNGLLYDFQGDLTAKLFDLKRRSEKTNEKNIHFDDVCEVFGFGEDMRKINILYEFIEYNGLFNDKDCINWENLSFILFEFEDESVIRSNAKKVLAEYYRKVEKNYEKIIKEIMFYYECCIPNIANYENYADHVENYLYDKLKSENELLRQENQTLKIERDNYKNKFEFYDKRKEYIMFEQLYHEGKSNYCMVLLSKLECIKYDFFKEYTKDEEFEKELESLKSDIKTFINKYDKYYNSYIRRPKEYKSPFNKEKILKESGEFIKFVDKFIENLDNKSKNNLLTNDTLSEISDDPDELD